MPGLLYVKGLPPQHTNRPLKLHPRESVPTLLHDHKLHGAASRLTQDALGQISKTLLRVQTALICLARKPGCGRLKSP